MEMPPAAQGRRASTVVERKLDELCACLDDALSQRGPGAEARLAAEIKAKTDFLRSLLAAEAECHGGARPEHLAEAEARFAVLEATFDQWARRAVAAPEPEEKEVGEPEEEADYSESSGSTCSCTDSCQEAAPGDAVEARKEVTADGIAIAGKGHDAEREDAGTRGEAASDAVAARKREAMGTRDYATPKGGVGKKRDADLEALAETGRRTVVQRRWWRRGAAWCGAAGVVALVAVGVAVELAAVAHHNVNVYVVPT
ncbi:LOW QUALITY PROTEIN: hypothetical protein SETIT_7G192500v2 [Setaria italica]|uniref:DUF7610 domain-containing protein n=2 Tax=Setaria TaxID=4554 RepID=A0A368RXE8_SETIT|nr:LOW QUALITY PROTEIN: hypothetical protein SETIT_7G192500v2 [Setaria italica]TKW05868.1 LOW QUALITY PROTEIN: hypothetical protein SEVIR_7G204400v2 [Setaria viridis]